MPVIGTFKASKQGGWEGTLRTLTINQKIRLVPNDDRVSESAPAFRVMLGWQHIGDAWEARSEGQTPRDYLRVRIDDPLLAHPLRAVLFSDRDGQSARLFWSRPRDV